MPKLILNKRLEGEVIIPPSKSILHRILILSSLSQQESTITNVSYSEDIKATISSLEALGIEFIKQEDSLRVIPHKIKKIKDLDANESGSTLRFMIPLMLLQDEEISIKGKNRLVNRPLDDYINIFKDFNISYSYSGALPLTVKGPLKPGKYYLNGNKSSQFISGLLMALPLLAGDSEIILKTELESVEYVNMTIKLLSLYNVKIKKTPQGYFIKGQQKYKAIDYSIPGDFSQAAFFLVANCLGSAIKIKGLEANKLQGDERIIDILLESGVTFGDDYLVKGSLKKPIDISLKDEPDLAPILALYATSLNGLSVLRDLKRLEYKESNRLIATKNLLEGIGVKAYIKDYDLYIEGAKAYNSAYLSSYNDHRILMTEAIATILTGEIMVDDLKPINKSFPNFFLIFKSLGGEVYE